jgi:hypothetical protein
MHTILLIRSLTVFQSFFLLEEHINSDVPGLAQSRKLGQAKPVWAGPSQAFGDGSTRALAWLSVAESQSR